MGIKYNYTEVFAVAHTIVTTIGRMKYLSGIYNTLMTTIYDTAGENKVLAKNWYAEAYLFYSPYA